MSFSPADFIRGSLKLTPVAEVPGLELYQAHPGSRLSRLDRSDPPYWAYAWGGGVVLAQYIQQHPGLVIGRGVLDLGAGSGLVGIVAAKLGAIVAAAEPDLFGKAAIRLNAEANRVDIDLIDVNIDGPAPPGFDLILAGDVFYLPQIAARMLPFLRRCRDAGTQVLIGDPERKDLPHQALERVHAATVTDMGGVARQAGVYRLR